MNERILELAEQAGFKNGTFDGYWVDDGGVERFAKLIVRECIETMKRTLDTECINENEKYGCMYSIVDVKDHFGVHDDGDLTITFRS